MKTLTVNATGSSLDKLSACADKATAHHGDTLLFVWGGDFNFNLNGRLVQFSTRWENDNQVITGLTTSK